MLTSFFGDHHPVKINVPDLHAHGHNGDFHAFFIGGDHGLKIIRFRLGVIAIGLNVDVLIGVEGLR